MIAVYAGGVTQTGLEWLDMPILEDGLSNLLTDDDFQVQPLHMVHRCCLYVDTSCNSAQKAQQRATCPGPSALLCGAEHDLH